MKKVLAVTGIRSEYDIIYPVLKKLDAEDNFDLSVAVSNAHLSKWHDYTVEKIEQDGFRIADRIDSLFNTDRLVQRSKGTGALLYGLSQTIERVGPDFLLVVGDREESIATAIAGNYMNTLVCHFNGGDPVYGNADDPVRFAVSKLAHIHFTFTEPYKENLLTVGEEAFRIFNVGNPALENILEVPEVSLDEISEKLEFDISSDPYIIFLKHPLSSQREKTSIQMRKALKAVTRFAEEHHFKIVGIYPNTDPGAGDIIEVIEEFAEKDFIRFFRQLPREIFVNVVRNAKALAGNSSMGILEAPFYRLPVVNIGDRQKGRLTAGNVSFVDYDADNIVKALEKACFDETYRQQIGENYDLYGDGNSSSRVLKALREIDLNDSRWYTKTKLC